MNKHKTVVFKATTTAVSLLLAFGFLGATPALADQVPAACTNNDFVLNLGQSSTVVYDETSPFGATTITYTVTTGNPNTSGSGCNVDSVDVNVTTPDGAVHNLQTNGSYPIGTAVAVLGTVNYVANSSNKTGQVLVTTANASGDLHDNPVVIDPLNITKQVSALVINPTTVTSISSSAAAVVAGGTVALTVTEQNDGNANLTNVHVDVDNGVGTLSAPPTSGDDGDAILEPGETWSWTVNGVVVNANTTFTATGHGTDILNNDVTYPADQDERDSVVVSVVNPTTITSISSSAGTVLPGGTVNLTVTEKNDGDVNLTGVHVDVDNGVGTLSSPPTSGDDGDAILEPGETWSWIVNGVVVNANTTFIATGHGMDPLNNDVTFPADQQERDSVAVTIKVGGQYCSPGYWKQSQHFDSWVGYTPNQKFSAVFGETITIMWSSKGKPSPVTDPTLLQALEANGGGINSLARATVDALLNSTSMNYSMTSAQVISAFQAVYPGTSSSYDALKAQFTIAENCPLN